MSKAQKILLDTCIENFIIDERIRGSSPYTISYYERVLRYFRERSGIASLDELNITVCGKYVLSLMQSGLASTSVQTYVRGFRVFLHWLFENDYMETDLSQRLRLPKAQRKVIDVLTDAEALHLFSCFDVNDFHQLRNLCTVFLMMGSGLRLNEVITLKADKFHLDEGFAIVDGKCNKQRIVPICQTAVPYFKHYLSIKPPSDLLICQINGNPMTSTTMKDIFRKLKKSTGIARLHPHLLRHTFATRYLENGGNIYSLQTILGHSTLEMVKRYLHLDNRAICKNFDSFSPVDTIQRRQASGEYNRISPGQR